MKNPGPVTIGTNYHRQMVLFAQELAKRFEIAEGPALGQLLRLDEALRDAADSSMKMSALQISVLPDHA